MPTGFSPMKHRRTAQSAKSMERKARPFSTNSSSRISYETITCERKKSARNSSGRFRLLNELWRFIDRGSSTRLTEAGTRFAPTFPPPPLWRFPRVCKARRPADAAATCGNHKACPRTVVRSRPPGGRRSLPSGRVLCNAVEPHVPSSASPAAAQ